jgi:uncharacterized protein YbaR (Trm112 family)
MVRDWLLNILRCPEDFSSLTLADEALVSRVNTAIRQGTVRNKSGRQVEQAIDGGFVRAAGDVLYPIVDQIPVLLRDEAIELDQVR